MLTAVLAAAGFAARSSRTAAASARECARGRGSSSGLVVIAPVAGLLVSLFSRAMVESRSLAVGGIS